jgi:hypothetical protein
MRIYLAGPFTTNITCHPIQNPNLQMFNAFDHLWCLESYHYFRGTKIDGLKARRLDVPPTSIFLDSGAFSMFTQNIEVDLDAYAEYIHENLDLFHVASNLDHIGRGGEQKTYDNQKYLESLGVKIQPVHHARDDDRWLVKYLDEGYDYIFLGGMVPESTEYLREWLDRIWGKYLTKPDGTARVKVHGFGLTTYELMFRYPWFSVDSTSWIMGSRMGTIYLDMAHKQVKIAISDQSPATKARDQHYDTLSPMAKEAVDAYIYSMGFKPEDLRTQYGMRDLFNARYFTRIQDRGCTHFDHHPQAGLFD